MRVYKVLPKNDHDLCHPEDWEGFNNAIADRSGSIDWRPFRVRLVHSSEGRKLRRSDAPWWGSHVLILRPKAVELLGPYLREHGQLLSLECDEDVLQAFKASRVVDALSTTDSDVARFSDGSISIVWRHVFKPEALLGADVFKLPNFNVSPIFATDPFVERWRSAGLEGVEFDEIWAGEVKH